MLIAVLICLPALMGVEAPASEKPVPGSQSMANFGANPLLGEGARLLEAGSVEDGIRMTLEGLKSVGSDDDRAVGLSNLCAGYAMLKRWDEALPHCDAALRLDPRSWRAYNNRAAVYSAKSLYARALDDLREALKIAPDSPTLRRTLNAVQQNIRIERDLQRERSRPGTSK